MQVFGFRILAPKASTPAKPAGVGKTRMSRLIHRAGAGGMDSIDEPVDESKILPSIHIENRRVVLATAVLLATSAGKALAFGKSAKELARESKARREKLKAASAKMKEKGKSESAFADSKFGLGEDATTPNRVNRTGEGGAGI